MKLWSKGIEAAPLIEHYEAARNAALDSELARFDIWGSLAHAAMLKQIGVLTASEEHALHSELCHLLCAAEDGILMPSSAEEDIHTLVEQHLTEQLGEIGKKIHTGRSRNDQVLVDLRLYAKNALNHIAADIAATAEALLVLAAHEELTPLPGYTHMQRGMLSSVGLWAAAHAEALLDDMAALESAYALNDRCPLGSGAAYGSPLPLDREYTAKLLGFSEPVQTTLAAGNGRGKGEAAVVQALSLVMLDLSKFAQDMLLFTTSEFAFFQVPAELCSGSSMMPQKHNLGALELVRARAHTVAALANQILGILSGLPSGYNMDYQETKAPFMEAIRICRESLDVVRLYAANLTVNHESVLAACTPEIFATDAALELVRAGVPFRDAYRQVAASLATLDVGDIDARLTARTHLGTTGNLGLPALQARATNLAQSWQQRADNFTSTISALIDGATIAHEPSVALGI
jgi:argininosuccinate lyase